MSTSDDMIAANRFAFVRGFLDRIKEMEEFPYLEWFDVAVAKAAIRYPFPVVEMENVNA